VAIRYGPLLLSPLPFFPFFFFPFEHPGAGRHPTEFTSQSSRLNGRTVLDSKTSVCRLFPLPPLSSPPSPFPFSGRIITIISMPRSNGTANCELATDEAVGMFGTTVPLFPPPLAGPSSGWNDIQTTGSFLLLDPSSRWLSFSFFFSFFSPFLTPQSATRYSKDQQ